MISTQQHAFLPKCILVVFHRLIPLPIGNAKSVTIGSFILLSEAQQYPRSASQCNNRIHRSHDRLVSVKLGDFLNTSSLEQLGNKHSFNAGRVVSGLLADCIVHEFRDSGLTKADACILVKTRVGGLAFIVHFIFTISICFRVGSFSYIFLTP